MPPKPSGDARKPKPAKLELPENPTDKEIEQAVWSQLKTVYDPEIPIDIATWWSSATAVMRRPARVLLKNQDRLKPMTMVRSPP